MPSFNLFHEGTTAKVIVGQECMEPFNVCDALRQGSALFSLYFGAVVDDWRSVQHPGWNLSTFMVVS